MAGANLHATTAATSTHRVAFFVPQVASSTLGRPSFFGTSPATSVSNFALNIWPPLNAHAALGSEAKHLALELFDRYCCCQTQKALDGTAGRSLSMIEAFPRAVHSLLLTALQIASKVCSAKRSMTNPLMQRLDRCVCTCVCGSLRRPEGRNKQDTGSKRKAPSSFHVCSLLALHPEVRSRTLFLADEIEFLAALDFQLV